MRGCKMVQQLKALAPLPEDLEVTLPASTRQLTTAVPGDPTILF